MRYYACYFLLATMNYNCFKNFMEKRHYINKKKSLHAGHVWYNYFFFSFFFFLLAWKWTFRDLWHGIHTLVLLSHDFFEFRMKKCNPREPSSSHESLHLLQNCFELLRTSVSHCKCTEGIPCRRCQDGLKHLNGKR